MIPTKVFFTSGVGSHRDQLTSFEIALRDADIEKYNIVMVSSIFPPGCKILTKEEGLKYLKPGQIVYSVFAKNQTDEPSRFISAAVGLAIPSGNDHYGYLSEYHAFGLTEKEAGDYAEDLAATMLATTLGIEFDPTIAWDERKEIYNASGRIFNSMNICKSAYGSKNHMWTTVIAAAIFLI